MTRKELSEKIIDALDITDKQDYNIVPYRYKAVTLVESLLSAALEEAKKHGQHCGSCHEDHAEGYMPSDECTPYCCCEGMRAEDERVKEAKAAAYEEGKFRGREEMLIECTDRHAKRVMDRVKEEVKEAYLDAAKIVASAGLCGIPCVEAAVNALRAKAGEVGK